MQTIAFISLFSALIAATAIRPVVITGMLRLTSSFIQKSGRNTNNPFYITGTGSLEARHRYEGFFRNWSADSELNDRSSLTESTPLSYTVAMGSPSTGTATSNEASSTTSDEAESYGPESFIVSLIA